MVLFTCPGHAWLISQEKIDIFANGLKVMCTRKSIVYVHLLLFFLEDDAVTDAINTRTTYYLAPIFPEDRSDHGLACGKCFISICWMTISICPIAKHSKSLKNSNNQS